MTVAPREAVGSDLARPPRPDAPAPAPSSPRQPWTARASRRTALGLLTAAALLGSAVLVLPRPVVRRPAGVAALAVGLLLLLVGTGLARLRRDAPAGLLLAVLALPYGFVGGLLVAAPTARPGPGSAAVLVAAAATLLFTVLGAAGTALPVPFLPGAPLPTLSETGPGMAYRLPAFIGAAVVLLALAGTALVGLVAGTSSVRLAAVLCALGVAALPVLATPAELLARLPFPFSPAPPDREKVAANGAPADGAVVASGRGGALPGTPLLARRTEAGRYLTVLLAAVSAVVLGCVPVLVGAHRGPAWSLALVAALLLVLRSRTVPSLPDRLPPLAAGAVGLGVLLVWSAAGDTAIGDLLTPPYRVALAFTTLLVLGAALAAYGLLVAGRLVPRRWSRAVDVIELVLGLSVVPLTAAVCGVDALTGWLG